MLYDLGEHELIKKELPRTWYCWWKRTRYYIQSEYYITGPLMHAYPVDTHKS